MWGHHSADVQDSGLLGCRRLSVVWRGGGWYRLHLRLSKRPDRWSPSETFGIKILTHSEPVTSTRIEPEDSWIPPRNSVYTRLLACSWIIAVLLAHTECSLRSHILTSTVVTSSLILSSYPARQFRIGVCNSTATSCISNTLCSNFAVHFTVYLLNYILHI